MGSQVHRFQHDDEWLDFRKRGVGASEVSCLVGLNPWMSELELWERKTERREDDVDHERMKWGRRLEGTILEGFAEDAGVPAKPFAIPGERVILQSIDSPFMLATLDGVADPDAVVEIKNTSEYQLSKWEDDAPAMYQVQLQVQMGIAERPRGYVVGLVGGNKLKYYEYSFDAELFAGLVETVERFMSKVNRDEMPEPDGSVSAAATLARLFPESNGETIVLSDPALVEIDQRLDALYRERKRSSSKKGDIYLDIKELEAQIKSAIGENTKAVLLNGTTYTWKEQTNPERIMPATTFRMLRRKAG